MLYHFLQIYPVCPWSLVHMTACIKNCIQLLKTEVKTCNDFNMIKCIFLSSGSLVVSNIMPICITTDIKYPVPLLLSAPLLLVHGCFLKTTSWSEMSSRASSTKSKFQARNGGKGSGRWRACISFFILCIWGLCRHGTLTCLHFTRQKLVMPSSCKRGCKLWWCRWVFYLPPKSLLTKEERGNVCCQQPQPPCSVTRTSRSREYLLETLPGS